MTMESERLHSVTLARSPAFWRRLMLLTLLIGLVWIYFSRAPAGATTSDRTMEAPIVGLLAPDFTLTALDGGEMQLSSLRGQPVILNFWATWCPPCRAEMPELEALWQRYRDNGLLLIGVDQGESAATVERYARDIVGTTFPLLLDTNQAVGRAYGVRALPTTVLIDRQGRIQEIRIGGPLNRAMLAAGVNKIMEQ
jgi:cytochrome c biogenesis protein CcmG, thiol:disulfide interchange protein DsbE